MIPLLPVGVVFGHAPQLLHPDHQPDWHRQMGQTMATVEVSTVTLKFIWKASYRHVNQLEDQDSGSTGINVYFAIEMANNAGELPTHSSCADMNL